MIEIIKTFIPFGIKNKNNRIYTKDDVERHIQKFLDSRPKFGTFMDLAESGSIDISKISHSIDDIWIKNEKLIGKITILDTPYGKILQTLYESDEYFGVRPTSLGSVDSDCFVTINELITFNIVTMANDAYFTIRDIRRMKLKKIKEKYEDLI